ncbi:MAG: type II glyceraldehyde-3-phosphate dehydrogenase [Candidatus Micrarchaeota archaeon]|nr:type II glyceraldehyde-3-phosphate dehydrogenase [Candidatus Micrarchaeota archaeon]
MVLRVAVNGYGVIGKRVADAVAKQDDMQLVGVVKTKPNYEAKLAIKKGYNVYVPDAASLDLFKKANVPCEGLYENLFSKCDLVIDCTPAKMGAENKKNIYIPKKLKAIFQGGEKDNIADVSFVAQCNYEKAVNKNYVRVVSCNTTGLCRTMGAVDNAFGIESSKVVLIRRAADPNDIKTGPINAIVPETTIPSHQGPDVQTVLPIPIETVAIKVPTTLMHVHVVFVKMKKPATAQDVKNVFANTTRIAMYTAADGFESTAHLIDYARDLGRYRYDIQEIMVWEDSIYVNGNELAYIQAVHNESDVIPENVDAIRAMFNLCDAKTSIEKTNKSFGIK